MYPPEFKYLRATSVKEALEMLNSDPDITILAGGQSLMPLLKLRLIAPAKLLDLNFIPELRYIKEDGDVIRIGAMTTHNNIYFNELIRTKIPALSTTAHNIGDIQIRNRGTIGGSIMEADPHADYLPTLMALEAKVKLKSINNERIIDIKDFIEGSFQTSIKSGELLTEVIVPKNNYKFLIEKYARRKGDFALVLLVIMADISEGYVKDLRVAAGAQDPKPLRLREIEKSVKGRKVDDIDSNKLASELKDQLSPLQDLHGSSEYKKYVAASIFRRMVDKLFKKEVYG
ncbi:MAG: FAD binding domain-containing protein [Nitrososphaeria archaeon]